MKIRNTNLVYRKGVNVGAKIEKSNCDDCKIYFEKATKESFIIEGSRVVLCRKCWLKRLDD